MLQMLDVGKAKEQDNARNNHVSARTENKEVRISSMRRGHRQE